MAFEVLIKSSNRIAVSEPALHISKRGQAFTNAPFAHAAKILPKDDDGEQTRVRFNLLFDKKTKQLAIQLADDTETLTNFIQGVHANGQIHFYVRSSLKSIGRSGISGVFELEYDKDSDLWITKAEIPKPTEEDVATKKLEKKVGARERKRKSRKRKTLVE